MLKKICSLTICAVLSVSAFSGCSKKPDDVNIKNFIQPKKGEEIAVITIKDYGDIKIKLFEDEAPLAVKNFKALAEDRFYDELIIHRVQKDSVIQGGDPKGDGTGGKSVTFDSKDNIVKNDEGNIVYTDKGFNQEISDNLLNFTGAVGYATDYTSMNKSQFYILSTKKGEVDDDYFKLLKKDYKKLFADNVVEKYKEVGGEPYFDGSYTIFGQVFEGMEVVERINEVKVNSSYKPNEQIMIEKVEIVKYQ